jgi:hypothetical protein
LALLPGCKPRHKQLPITVHLLRDLNSIYASNIDHAMLDFQAINPKITSGRPILVESIELHDYKDLLANHVGSDLLTDLIILDSQDDAALNPMLMAQLPNAVNVCASVRVCPQVVPSIIPPNTAGDALEAAKSFQKFLAKGHA